MAEINITYNTYDLQYEDPTGQNTILTRDILYRQMGDKNIILREDTIRDGFDVVDIHYSRKIIMVRGWLISNSQANLRTLRDNFMNALRPNEGDLDIDYGSGTIRYKATVQSIMMPEEHWHITQIPFEIEFLCEPFGKASASSSSAWSNQASSLSNEDITITGTYKCLPTITIRATQATITKIKFENETNDDWIEVETTFIVGKDLIIDCENETVRFDSDDVDFTGIFPSISPGDNKFHLTITGSGYKYNLTISYWPRYL